MVDFDIEMKVKMNWRTSMYHSDCDCVLFLDDLGGDALPKVSLLESLLIEILQDLLGGLPFIPGVLIGDVSSGQCHGELGLLVSLVLVVGVLILILILIFLLDGRGLLSEQPRADEIAELVGPHGGHQAQYPVLLPMSIVIVIVIVVVVLLVVLTVAMLMLMLILILILMLMFWLVEGLNHEQMRKVHQSLPPLPVVLIQLVEAQPAQASSVQHMGYVRGPPQVDPLVQYSMKDEGILLMRLEISSGGRAVVVAHLRSPAPHPVAPPLPLEVFQVAPPHEERLAPVGRCRRTRRRGGLAAFRESLESGRLGRGVVGP
mmetsp:Transcript_43037/g.131038  ORF Transcript_43037/g.131038 Transcript_43037/m.131038 type:complete len:317 (-) Transcript_43037:466-1416(-)